VVRHHADSLLNTCCYCCLIKSYHCVSAGVVVAVKGRAEPGGDFVVSGVLWPGLPEQPQRPLPQEDTYVALVSGLQLANSKADMMQVRDLGLLGDTRQFRSVDCEGRSGAQHMGQALAAVLTGQVYSKLMQGMLL
jgi:hypothetical protein